MKKNKQAPALIFLFLLLVSLPLAAYNYIYVDKNGRTQMEGSLPPEIAARGDYKIVSNSGRFIKNVPLSKTPEQRAKEKEEERLRKINEAIIAEEKAQDQILLKTYQSVDEIKLALNRQLESIDVRIQITRGTIKRLKVRLEGLQKDAAQAERAGRPITKNLLQDIDGTRNQLKKAYESIILAEKKKEQIRETFNSDMKRFASLTKLKEDSEEAAVVISHNAVISLLETVYECKDKLDCDAAWIRAEAYTRKYATTHMQMLGKRIIMTARPIRNDDISITVSRIKPDQTAEAGQPIQLFLDLQCRNNSKGQSLCNSDASKKIKQEFKAYVADNAEEKQQLLADRKSK